jgi:hypothetical protein
MSSSEVKGEQKSNNGQMWSNSGEKTKWKVTKVKQSGEKKVVKRIQKVATKNDESKQTLQKV